MTDNTPNTWQKDRLWISELHASLQATTAALGINVPDDDSHDWLLVAAIAIQAKAESMAPPTWVTTPDSSWRCTGCGAIAQTPGEHDCSPDES